MGSLGTGLQRIFSWVIRLAYLNFLWLAFTLLGLGIVGFAPATAAMFAVTRRWVLGEREVEIFDIFRRAYRADFIKANMLGYLLLLLGAALYLDVRLLPRHGGVIGVLLGALAVGLMIAFGVALLYLPALFAQFQLRTLQYLKWSLAIGLAHPLLTLVMAAGVVGIYLFLLHGGAPALVVVLGGSLPALLLSWGAQKAFVSSTNLSASSSKRPSGVTGKCLVV